MNRKDFLKITAGVAAGSLVSPGLMAGTSKDNNKLRCIFMFIIFGLFMNLCFAEVAAQTSKIDKGKNDLIKMNLKGEVLSIKEISYKAVENSGKIIKGKRARKDSWDSDKYFRFNKYGNEIEVKSYNSDGGLTSKVIYKYDYNQKKIEKITFDPSNNRKSEVTYKNDDKGNLIEVNSYESNGTLRYKSTYKNDDKGNPIVRNSYEYGILKSKGTTKYDDRGNDIEDILYSSGGIHLAHTTSKYDDRGNQIESIMYHARGEVQYKRKRVWTFNNKDNIIEKYKYDPNGSIEDKWTYKYEFDEKNNWIKKVEIENEIPTFILEREIEYINPPFAQTQENTTTEKLKKDFERKENEEMKLGLDSSWVILSSPKILNWKQIGLPEPLNSTELKNHIEKESFGMQIKGFGQGGGGVLVLLNKLLFSEEMAEIEGMGVIPASYVHISNVDETGGNTVMFTIEVGYTLPVVDMTQILAVGSVMVIDQPKSPVKIYNHFIRHGTIKVVSEGLELQSGLEILESN